MIDEADEDNTLPGRVSVSALIERYSLEEHIAFADAYFDGREEHLYLYQKPFYHPADSAALVSNLGQLLEGARLEAGMEVLDFAAGSCWLSKILVELGCRVTSSDVSAKALAIGKRLLERFPPIQAACGLPAFLPYDGKRLDLAAASMDRIIVNDSFHHVTNTAEVLQDFFRILKPGGLVALSEPGRFHSRSEASQSEMRDFNVVENDLVLEDIWAQAKEAGFWKIEIAPVLRRPYMNIDEYLEVIAGRVPAHLLVALQQHCINHSIFFLHKAIELTRENFDEAFYLSVNRDVAAAVEAGKFQSGWDHYERYGRAKHRSARSLRRNEGR